MSQAKSTETMIAVSRVSRKRTKKTKMRGDDQSQWHQTKQIEMKYLLGTAKTLGAILRAIEPKYTHNTGREENE